MARRPENTEKQEKQQRAAESPNGAFKVTLEGPVEGRPNLQRLRLEIIDGEIVPLIYDATARQLLITPNYQQVEKLQGLFVVCSALLAGAGVAVPACKDCEFTLRQQGTDNSRQYCGCPQRNDGTVCEGCTVSLCRFFRELTEARRAEEKAAREDEIRAAKEVEEMERLEELERKELRRLRRKHGRDSEED